MTLQRRVLEFCGERVPRHVGLGAGVGMTLTNDLIMTSVRPEQSWQAAAISETAYEIGTAFGAAILDSSPR